MRRNCRYLTNMRTDTNGRDNGKKSNSIQGGRSSYKAMAARSFVGKYDQARWGGSSIRRPERGELQEKLIIPTGLARRRDALDDTSFGPRQR